MRKYELTYLVSDEVQEADLNKVTGKISGLIGELGGKLEKEDIWGRRKLAYPIKKQGFATYVTVFFSLSGDRTSEFEKDLNLMQEVVRHLTIVREHGNEAIALTTEDIVGTKDIETVIGGEKSFEAVEGETEESKTLMAKREEKEKEEEIEDEKTAKPEVEEIKPVKEAKKTEKKTSTKVEKEEKKIQPEDKTEDKKEELKKDEKKEKTAKEKPAAAKKAPAKKKEVSDEAERLSKLNEELDDILKDEL